MRANRILVVTMIVAVVTLGTGLRAQKRDHSAPYEPPTVLFMCPHGAAKSVLRGTLVQWDDVPPLSENFARADEAIRKRVTELIEELVRSAPKKQ